MKKITGVLFLLFGMQTAFAQNSKFAPFAEDIMLDSEQRVNYVRFKESQRVNQEDAAEFINSLVFSNGINKVELISTDRDELGFTHSRYNILQNNIKVASKMIIAHCYAGKLVSVNGDLYDIKSLAANFILSETSALNFALGKIKAQKYKWENKAEELHMREVLDNPSFSYYPQGIKTIFEKNGRLYAAYVFNIYAELPLYRANVYVDATNGKILFENNLICTADVPGTANTKYSGTQTITCDQNGTQYRLKETGRGLGVETYNLQNTTTYAMNNFTNASTNWTTTGVDQGATDAHWGAEKTYDYYFTQHNRNSINGNGMKLISYVHYGTNYSNAFWDGQRMTYGDGNGSTVKIFTTLDICGHEITHGLTDNTANLVYSNESGALNESYSDIFGTCIENYGRPANWNWKCGEDLTNNGTPLRNLANPNQYGDPDCYGGTNWYVGTADNGGVHTNSGVSNFWFYLLTMGGSGINDLANTYSVSPLGFTDAGRIAFRALTVYYTPSTNFATARNLSIQAARDIFGTCSHEMIQTMNAWHAVGVGAKFTPGVVAPNFVGDYTTFCSLPATISFVNTTPFALSYSWDFGDGSVATTTNAVHTYTANGNYSVKLKATGCSNLVDSLTKASYIVVNVPAAPTVSNVAACENNPIALTASGTNVLKWYDSPSSSIPLGVGTTFTAPAAPTNTTYYVANTVPSIPVTGGMLTNSGGSYITNSAQWLVFNVVQTSTLNSVVVYANTAGSKTVELRNAANVTIYSAPVTVTAGPNTVYLFFPLTIGTNYRLGLAAGTANLFRSNSGVSYPYNIGGCVSIVNSSAGTGAYYWFYKWEVIREDCTSPLVPVNVSMFPQPVVTIASSASLMCKDDHMTLTGTPSGGFFSGSGVSGQTFNGSFLTAGTYPVYYNYADANGCSNTASKAVQIEECTGISSLTGSAQSIEVYPNPAKNSVSISGLSSSELSHIIISDVSGRMINDISGKNASEKVDVSSLSAGLYMISVTDDAGKVLKSVKLVKE